MLFVLGKNEPRLFAMLIEEDLVGLRKGQTRFVDAHQLKTSAFNGLTISLHKDNAEIEKLLRGLGHDVTLAKEKGEFAEPAPGTDEATCNGCKGIMKFSSLLDGKCIVCWRDKAIGGADEIKDLDSNG